MKVNDQFLLGDIPMASALLCRWEGERMVQKEEGNGIPLASPPRSLTSKVKISYTAGLEFTDFWLVRDK